MEEIIRLCHDHATNELVAMWGEMEIARGPHGDPESYADVARKAGEWLANYFG